MTHNPHEGNMTCQTATGQGQDKELILRGRKLAYQVWKQNTEEADKRPIIFLHGWLDNAASFSPLVNQLLSGNALSQNSFYALDFAGQGKSTWRSSEDEYTLQTDCADLLSFFNSLNIHSAIIIGHSRGAMVAWLFAALYPERTERCVFIDGMLPPPVGSDAYLKSLRESIMLRAQSDHQNFHSKASRFKDVEDAIRARMRSQFPVDYACAKYLAERGLLKEDDKVYWSYDPRLKSAHPYRFYRDQIMTINACFQTEALLIWATKGVLAEQSHGVVLDSKLSSICNELNIRTAKVAGSHHCHTGLSVQATAKAVIDFLRP